MWTYGTQVARLVMREGHRKFRGVLSQCEEIDTLRPIDLQHLFRDTSAAAARVPIRPNRRSNATNNPRKYGILFAEL